VHTLSITEIGVHNDVCVGHLKIGIVVNYNSTTDAIGCCKSLIAGGIDRVMVWDNASSEPIEELSEFAERNPSVVLWPSERNLGFGAAVNRAVALASEGLAEGVIWIVNPDATVSKSALEHLHRALDDGWDFVSPVIFTGAHDHPTIWFAGGELDVASGNSQPVVEPLAPESVKPATFLTGAALCTKLSTWRALGGFRNDLFMYWEDADLSYRATSRGFRLGVVADASVWHRVGGSQEVGGKSRLYYYYMGRNRIKVCAGAAGRFGIVFGKGARVTLRFVRAAIGERDAALSKSMAFVWGTITGLVGTFGTRSAIRGV